MKMAEWPFFVYVRKFFSLSPSPLNPHPSTLNPSPSSLNPHPSTLNLQPTILPSRFHRRIFALIHSRIWWKMKLHALSMKIWKSAFIRLSHVVRVSIFHHNCFIISCLRWNFTCVLLSASAFWCEPYGKTEVVRWVALLHKLLQYNCTYWCSITALTDAEWLH